MIELKGEWEGERDRGGGRGRGDSFFLEYIYFKATPTTPGPHDILLHNTVLMMTLLNLLWMQKHP